MVAAVAGPASTGTTRTRHSRVTERAAYTRIQSRGARVHTPHFVILVWPRDVEPPSPGPSAVEGTMRRLGITVTKKVAKRAVDRNRVKRLVREVFRRELDVFPEGCDVVFVAKAAAWELSYREVASEVVRVRGALAAAARKARAASRAT